MPAKLVHNSYGKSAVRLTKVTRLADRHELAELTVNISLEGDFARSYTHGDNSSRWIAPNRSLRTSPGTSSRRTGRSGGRRSKSSNPPGDGSTLRENPTRL